ncbi:MAG: carbohydrate-binding family 9-like protein [Acidobacteriota bacterium]
MRVSIVVPFPTKFRLPAALLILFSGLQPLAAAETPVYSVFRVPSPIRVDGRLDEAAWSAVSPVGPFVNNRDGSPTDLKTEARIVYDDRFLYFAFRSWDENIWSTFRARDAHLWEEEVVEVFIQADPVHPSYIELEVNPLGALLDIFLLDIRKPLPYGSWNPDVRWAVQVVGSVDGKEGDREWSCEIAFPLRDVVTAPHLPPGPGDRWRVNLYRVEKLPDPAGLAWSPTGRADFHIPSRFGEIVFSHRVAR